MGLRAHLQTMPITDLLRVPHVWMTRKRRKTPPRRSVQDRALLVHGRMKQWHRSSTLRRSQATQPRVFIRREAVSVALVAGASESFTVSASSDVVRSIDVGHRLGPSGRAHTWGRRPIASRTPVTARSHVSRLWVILKPGRSE